MKGNLPVKEKEILQFWDGIKLYGKLLAPRTGPPSSSTTARLTRTGTYTSERRSNKILKDIIVKSKFMAGFRADYVPGLGLSRPSHRAPGGKGDRRKSKQPMPSSRFASDCRKYAERVHRYPEGGVQEARRHRGLGPSLHHHGLRVPGDHHRGDREVLRAGRGLQEEEARPLVHQLQDRARRGGDRIRDEDVAFHLREISLARNARRSFQGVPEKAAYSCSSGPRRHGRCRQISPLPSTPISRTSRSRQKSRSTSWSKDLCEEIPWQRPVSLITASSGRFPPRTLKGLTFRHPFIDGQSVVVFADYVTKDVGTGAVHIAPGHGEEDYETGLEYGLDVYSPVNEKGEFTEEVKSSKA